MITDLPVFGICGNAGSGRTTLIEQLVPRLREKGLHVAVMRQRSAAGRFELRALELAFAHDLVLVEGGKSAPVPKVWLLVPHAAGRLAENEKAVASRMRGTEGVLAVLDMSADRVSSVMAILDDWLPKQWLRTPVFGCVLIGGESRRMGRPKHLLEQDGRKWLERIVDCLRQVTERVAILGEGVVPQTLSDCIGLPDVPDAKGPLAGILAAMRWAPEASWLVAACDLPYLSVEALQWLLSMRRPGVWATLPRLPGSPGVEPLLAHYDCRARLLLEQVVARGEFRPSLITLSPKVITPTPPLALCPAWTNVNLPEELP